MILSMALVLTQAFTLERGTPWYWPVGEHFQPSRLLQRYGQYETVMGVPSGLPTDHYDVHHGIDIESYDGESVRAPIDGDVLEVDKSAAPYGGVVLQAPNGWKLMIDHLVVDEIAVIPNQSVQKGDLLGEVASWDSTSKPDGFEHVHLELTKELRDGSLVNADPLPFLGGRSDYRAPFFLQFGAGVEPSEHIAFVTDIADPYDKGTDLSALVFHDGDSLPQEDLDVLVRAGDYFSTMQPQLILFPITWPSFPIPVVTGFKGFVIDFGGPRLTPAILSLRITNWPNPTGKPIGEEVFSKTIDFSRGISTVPYLEPGTVTRPSYGWPDADFYFLVTHSETEKGAWQAGQDGAGQYRVEVTLEDEAGNLSTKTRIVTVDGP